MTVAVPEPPHLVTDLKDLVPGDDDRRVAASGRPGHPRAPAARGVPRAVGCTWK